MNTRRKKRKRRAAPHAGKSQARQRPKVNLSRALARADRLLERNRAQEALELLKPLLKSYPREADLHYYLGYAHAKAGDMWSALVEYERVQKLSRRPDYQLLLVSLYVELGLNAHGLRALRQMVKHQLDFPLGLDAPGMIAAMERDMADLAREHNLTTPQAEKGLRDMERGQIELQQNNFPASIAASRRAIKSLGDWPPSHNNLSLALFWDGQPEKAIAVARQTLSAYPDNVHALSNGIRFLTWNGREDEARALWPRLEKIPPQDHGIRRKIVEAAAILGEDETVYRLLHAAPDEYELSQQERYFLAVAEANTGRHGAARRHWKALRQEMPIANELLAALKAGRPGPGWAERYPYFHSVELVPLRKLSEFIELVASDDDSRRRRSQIARFAARFPQSVLLAEKLIWEENQLDAGLAFLTTLATPAAYAALRRFGLSQAGEDDARVQALVGLLQAGEVTSDETLHVWLEGEWRDVQLHGHEVSGDLVKEYAPEVIELLDRGLRAFRQDDYARAERLFLRALELDPQATKGYNNLATVYAYQDKHAQAKEMFHAALEADPLYVMARCNLASYYLEDGEIAAAQAMLEPLAEVTQFHPQDMVFYQYVQARILILQEEFKAAQNLLKAALKIQPDYEPVQNLLERLERRELLSQVGVGFESLWERQLKRYQRKRAQLQTKLATPEPSLAEALSLYTKDALTGMGRAVIRGSGGWSTLRKAEMVKRIVAELSDADNLERLVTGLHDEEREGLRQVLAEGGALAWEDFDTRYDNDLDESPYWNWNTPETKMGRLRLRGLLVEATVDGKLLVAVPSDLRRELRKVLSGAHGALPARRGPPGHPTERKRMSK